MKDSYYEDWFDLPDEKMIGCSLLGCPMPNAPSSNNCGGSVDNPSGGDFNNMVGENYKMNGASLPQYKYSGGGKTFKNKYKALLNENGRIPTPFHISSQKLAFDILSKCSYNDDKSWKCETLMYGVDDGFVIMPNKDNDCDVNLVEGRCWAHSYQGTYYFDGVIRFINGEEWGAKYLVHTHRWGKKPSNEDRENQKLLKIPVYILFKDKLYDLDGKEIKY